MRDTNRLKEKYELSLDNRQIVTLTVATLVLLGGVFVLGVVVGKKLSAEQSGGAVTAAAPDLLTALDQKNAALEATRTPDASLTFQEELTKKTPAAVADVKPVEAAKPVVVEPAKPVEPPKVAEVFAKVEVPAVDAPKAKLPEAVKDSPKEEAIPTRTRDAGSLKEAFGKAQKSAAPETSATGSWTLQLSAYQDKAEADRFAAGLRDKGYAPFTVETNLPGKGTWYRVRMGRFANKDAASRYMNDFKRETSMNAFVTNAN